MLSGFDEVLLTGGDHANKLDVSAFTFGSVKLIGGAGNDSLVGGTQNDSMIGEAGNDKGIGGQGKAGSPRNRTSATDLGDAITAEIIDETFARLFAFDHECLIRRRARYRER